MPIGVPCGACGAVMPGRLGRCPACGARLWHAKAQVRGWLVVALLVMLGFATVGRLRRSPVDPDLAAEVQVYPGIRRLSADWTGTEVSGHIENRSPVPVDVVVRFRGRDITGEVVSEVVSRPYRNVPPDGSRPVAFKVATSPLQDFEIDIVKLSRSPK